MPKKICISFRKKVFFHKKVLLFIAITLIAWSPVLPHAYASIFTSLPPAIDGSAAEWTSVNSTRLTATNGFVHLMNDDNNLYVLVDVTSDTGDDPLPDNDWFWLTFDVNQNSVIDDGTDVNFGTIAGSLTPCIQWYHGPSSWTGCDNPAELLVVRGFGTSVNSATDHRIWELQIPRASIDATAPHSPLRFALRLVSENPSFDVNTPESPPDFWDNFSMDFLTDVTDLTFGEPCQEAVIPISTVCSSYGDIGIGQLYVKIPRVDGYCDVTEGAVRYYLNDASCLSMVACDPEIPSTLANGCVYPAPVPGCAESGPPLPCYEPLEAGDPDICGSPNSPCNECLNFSSGSPACAKYKISGVVYKTCVLEDGTLCNWKKCCKLGEQTPACGYY